MAKVNIIAATKEPVKELRRAALKGEHLLLTMGSFILFSGASGVRRSRHEIQGPLGPGARRRTPKPVYTF